MCGRRSCVVLEYPPVFMPFRAKMKAPTYSEGYLLDCFVKEIVLYDDKIEIYFNNSIKISPDGSRGFTFYSEDIKITYKDPYRSEPIRIQVQFEMKI